MPYATFFVLFSFPFLVLVWWIPEAWRNISTCQVTQGITTLLYLDIVLLFWWNLLSLISLWISLCPQPSWYLSCESCMSEGRADMHCIRSYRFNGFVLAVASNYILLQMLTLANINIINMFCLCCMPVYLCTRSWAQGELYGPFGQKLDENLKEWEQFIRDLERYQCDPNFKMIFDECDVFFLKNLQEHCYCAMSYECKACWNCTVRDHHPLEELSNGGKQTMRRLRAWGHSQNFSLLYLKKIQSPFSRKRKGERRKSFSLQFPCLPSRVACFQWRKKFLLEK